MRRAACAMLFACTVIAAASPAAQQAVFSSRADVVRVDVLVARGNTPVPGLTADDFEVRDNGVLQQATLVSADALPLNVVMAFDLSDSVTGPRLNDLQHAGRGLLVALTDRDRAALVTFGFAVTLAQKLTLDRDAVRRALDQPAGGGRTSLVDGCFAGLMLGTSEVGRSLLLVFSDGVDTASWLTPDAVVTAARRADVATYAVAAGKVPKPSFLRTVTDTTGGGVIEIENTKDVGPTFLRLLNEYRQRYLLSYTPTGVSREGWHQIDVRVKQRSVTVRARPGYLAGR